MANIKQKCQQLIDDAALLNADTETVPTNYAQLKKIILQKELKIVVATLRALVKKSSSLVSLQKNLKEFLNKRDDETNDTILSFFALPEGTTNALVWEIVITVFAPTNWEEMFALIFPKIKSALQITVDLPKNTLPTNRLHWSQFAIYLNNQPIATALANKPLALATLQQFACRDHLLFPMEQITSLPFALHEKCHQTLTNYSARLAKAIYSHNDDFEQVSKEVLFVQHGGKTPRTAISELIFGLELNGEKHSGNAFTEGASPYVGRFLKYLKELPTDLRKKVLALGNCENNNTIDGIIHTDIMRHNGCVETAARDANFILQYSPNAKTLDTLPVISKEQWLAIKKHYHQTTLNKNGKDQSQTIPEKISKDILKKYILSNSQAYIDLLLSIPTDQYKLFFTQVTIPEVPNDLHMYFEGDLLNPLQKKAFADVLYEHPTVLEHQCTCINLVLNSKCAVFTKAYFARYTTLEKEQLLTMIGDVLDFFVIATNSSKEMMNAFLDCMGEEWINKALVLRKSLFRETIRHHNGNFLARLLKRLPPQDRYQKLVAVGIHGLKDLEQDDDDMYDSSIEYSPEAQLFISPLLDIISVSDIEALLTKNNYYFFYLAANCNDPDLFCDLLSHISPDKRYDIHAAIIAFLPLEFYIKCLQGIQKLFSKEEFNKSLSIMYEREDIIAEFSQIENGDNGYSIELDLPEMILFLSNIEREKLKAWLFNGPHRFKAMIEAFEDQPFIVTEFILSLFSDDEKRAWAETNFLHELFEAAIKSNSMQKVDLVWKIIETIGKTNEYLTTTDDYSALAAAVAGNNAIVMEKIITLLPPNDLNAALENKIKSPFLYATSSNIETIKRLLEITKPENRLHGIMTLLKRKNSFNPFYQGKMEMMCGFLSCDDKLKLLNTELYNGDKTLDLLLYFPQVLANILKQFPYNERARILETRNARNETVIQAFIRNSRPSQAALVNVEYFLSLLPERTRIQFLQSNVYHDTHRYDLTLLQTLQNKKICKMLTKTDQVLELTHACRWYWQDLHQRLLLAAAKCPLNDETQKLLKNIRYKIPAVFPPLNIDSSDKNIAEILNKMQQVVLLNGELKSERSSSQKLREFQKVFANGKMILSSTDKSTLAFVKKVLRILGYIAASIPSLGGYAIYRAHDSKKRFNTYAFWKSSDEKFVGVCGAKMVVKHGGWRRLG